MEPWLKLSCRQTNKQTDKPDSTCWFSHQHSRAPKDCLTKPHTSRSQRALSWPCHPLPPAATQWTRLLLRTAYGLQCRRRVTMHCQWGWLSTFSFFALGDLDLWPWHSNSGKIFVLCS